jgi:Flp pilus assembly protein TadG
MKKRKIIKVAIITIALGIAIAGSAAYYMFNMPHRNVQKADADYALTTTQVVTEYLADKTAANEKYLATDGDSKILAITGIVSKISDDYNGQKVVLLKNDTDKAGVSCSFTKETNSSIATLQIGQTATIKGVIRSGASYDEDLEMYENVILEKSNLITTK